MKIYILFFLSCLFSSLLAIGQSPTPVAANGQLNVVGNQLTNESGKAIQLRGVSTHGLQWFPTCYTQSSVQAVAKDWGADVLRIAMYVDEGGYLSGKEAMRAKVNQIVDWAEQSGIYCIIDWHILNPGDPNVHTADAIEFFNIMSQRNAGKKHVIYEICNEPNGVNWSQIKSYAEQVIPVIRKNAPNAIVLVGTPNWDQRPQDVLSAPLAYTNLLYTVHFYAASHFFQNDVKSVTNQLPLFFSEWGTSTYSGGGNLDFTNGQAWLDLMAGSNPGNQKISWCNWTFSDAGESSAALNAGACNSQQWNNTSPSGTWVKDHILNPADDFGPATPSVAISSPANNTTVAIGTNLVINASVYNASATRVEFYNGTTLIGSDATAPYSWTIASLAQGTYSLTAKALISSGNLTSSVVQVTAAPAPNQAPIVSLTSPANNASFPLPATVTIAANAADNDGNISKVDFYNGSTKLGEDATAPYAFTWSGMTAGTYTLTARATDNQGAVTTSGAVTVLVYNQGDPDPTADLIGPNCVYPNAVQLFNVNANKLGNATSFSWWCTGSTKSITTVQAGKASIDFGASFTGGQVCVGINYSAAPWYSQYCKTVTVCPGTLTTPTNQSPSVSLTSPTTNATYTAPATVTLAASASDADGSIEKVEFYNGSTKLGERTSSPYQLNWTNVGAGTYALTAKATDNAGATTTSGTISIQVSNPTPTNQAPTVSLTAPATSATFTAPATIAISATANDTDGSVAKVEFYSGTTKLGESTTAPYQFSWTGVSTGTYTLLARATDNLGATTTSASVTIQVSNPTATTPNPGADLIGADCARPNDVRVYEVNARNLPNATQFSWWFMGSSQSISATQAGKASYTFGPSFTGGQVCVGINYSVAPWYSQYCKPVSVCSTGARAGADDVANNPVFPNPTNDQFTFVADRDIHSMSVANQTGREQLRLGSTKAGQTITFGDQLSPGIYLLHIRYENQEERTIKLLKTGN
ncbi:Ig-like domain-containing protein [Spirosoma agri]|uniref:Cellulase family glycosylhydrolase n=1 Tax=Spirosoma agri TaxID=1987381 RepID=A0A6M0IP66_9BACT|nr:Ig-like domain-containing protein [Spirosoma agri]NEU69737.1 cellulase family glycosylhydrolase [Spirosoma agri]